MPRRAAAAASASLAGSYTAAFARQATEHLGELERLVQRVSSLHGRVDELTARNVELADRNADLELAAALAAVAPIAVPPEEQSERNEWSTVVKLPVQQFDHAPVQHARASGE